MEDTSSWIGKPVLPLEICVSARIYVSSFTSGSLRLLDYYRKGYENRTSDALQLCEEAVDAGEEQDVVESMDITRECPVTDRSSSSRSNIHERKNQTEIS